ncbi:MAG TPA: hypothetical protein VGL56_12245 [Fimbriimonadaceae bacterium]|jgi:hypothetical protein
MSTLKSVALAAVACSFLSLASLSQAQTFWGQYGKDAQHDAMSTSGVQALNSILWQTPVDLVPVTDGTDVTAHYGSPLMTANTAVVNVRIGQVASTFSSGFTTTSGYSGVSQQTNHGSSVDDVYRVEGHDLGTGVTTWTEYSDYVDWMPHGWTPSFGSCIDSNGKVYSPGAGGTVWVYSNADSASGTSSKICFYGLTFYNGSPSLYDANVQICTPITVDASNNIYFGFYVTSGFNNVPGLKSGLAKISSTGVGTFVTADAASGNTGDEVATNCAPAVTADGNFVYVAVKQQGNGGYNNPKLLRLNTSDLSTANEAALYEVPYVHNTTQDGNTVAFPYIFDDGTSSPMIGPDGDVYYGIWWSDLESRGFMLHYSADLSTVKTPGAFGWDDTASVVPASAVPSYTGTSSYLILTKYNNYSDAGLTPFPGDGHNEVAVLDPNATEQYTVQYDTGDGTGPTYTTMKEVLTVVGAIANTGQTGVREWCINMAAIDVAGKAAVVNSEDGHCYRWDFTTNSLTQVQNLQPATGEAYTPTVVSADGISFAVNNAVLFAMWDGVKATNAYGFPTVAGNTGSGSIALSGNATGPGATFHLSSSNPNIQVPATVFVPAGSNQATFTYTSTTSDSEQDAQITATRYGFSATSDPFEASGSGLAHVNVSSNSNNGGVATSGSVTLIGSAPASGRTATLSCDNSAIKFGATSTSTPTNTLALHFGGGVSSQPFYFFSSGVATGQSCTITATLDDSTTVTVSVAIYPAVFSGFGLASSSITGGMTDTGSLAFTGGLPAAGLPTSVTYSAHTSGPATVNSTTSPTNFTITSTAVTSNVTETISTNCNGTVKTANVTITAEPTLVGFSTSDSQPYMTHEITGTVTLNGKAGGSIAVTATSLDANSSIITQPVVASGASSATFTIAASQLSVNTNQTAKVTVKYGTVTITGSFTVRPIFVTAVAASPTILHAGGTGHITITVSPYAGQLGLKVSLHSGSSVLTVPATAIVANNATTVTVAITAPAQVTGVNRVSITASCAGDNSICLVTVEP